MLTKITRILLLKELLSRGQAPEKHEIVLKVIQRARFQLSILLGKLLHYSRTGIAKAEFQFADIEFSPTLL